MFGAGKQSDFKKEIEKAMENVGKIETSDADAEHHIYQFFEEIKRQVDLRREELKSKIDVYSDEIIESVERYKLDHIKHSKSDKNVFKIQIDKYKNELANLIDRLDTFKIDDKSYKDVNDLNQITQYALNTYKASLIDKEKYSFVYDELPIEKVFGSLLDFKTIDSSIMNYDQQKQLIDVCEFHKDQEWFLIYRGSRDGFSSKAFHSKCDGIPRTLTVIKATTGNVFGGYTKQAWTSKPVYVRDPNAFIFSLVNKKDKPFKTRCSKKYARYAMACNGSDGPSFGGNNELRRDIFIASNSNANMESYSNFNFTYKHAEYPAYKETDESKTILAGTHKFQTVEIEVFSNYKDRQYWEFLHMFDDETDYDEDEYENGSDDDEDEDDCDYYEDENDYDHSDDEAYYFF